MKTKKSDKAAKKYELALVVKPLLPSDVTQKVIEPLFATIKELGGEASLLKDGEGKEYEIAKKHLAYQMDGHLEAYHVFIDLSLPSSSAKELERKLKFTQDVIRFLLINK